MIFSKFVPIVESETVHSTNNVIGAEEHVQDYAVTLMLLADKNNNSVMIE